ncbi:hypothetical protein ACWT_3338 [Actinoplanes sp. SE50]|nr:hypothetical protein ACPL_3466 [Actinoplanes sp. SE50/110]ATO82753.1 hypothetical protein ACWT_3338 [Actinoplanes sp. SE50]SLM00160.1 hypothetical protein ACSP50_3392 [Actinoplanes sp. SE50/110]
MSDTDAIGRDQETGLYEFRLEVGRGHPELFRVMSGHTPTGCEGPANISDSQRLSVGMVIQTVVPPPGVSLMSSLPPWVCTIRAQVDKPIP